MALVQWEKNKQHSCNKNVIKQKTKHETHVAVIITEFDIINHILTILCSHDIIHLN